MMTLFDDETIMRNHDAQIRREVKAENDKRLRILTNILLAAGRVDDIVRAAADPEYRDKLCEEMGIA